MPQTITIPLINPNEPDALIVALNISEGKKVSQGDLLCTIETTKSDSEIYADSSGYIVGLSVRPGQTVRAGEILCYLAEDASWKPPDMIPDPDHMDNQQITDQQPSLPKDLRITQPALELAKRSDLNLENLPRGQLVTEEVVLTYITGKNIDKSVLAGPTSEYDPTAILVYGGGGHGKALIELINSLNYYHIIGIVDDGIQKGETILGVPILGKASILPELHAQGIHQAANAVGGIGDINARAKVFQLLAQSGFTCPNLIHPTAYVETSATIDAGVQTFPHAYIGSEVKIGFGCIINTSAVVSHDCILDDFSNISPGAILAGEVIIGKFVLIGMGATINLRVKIGDGARIGNGATVKQHVPKNGIVRAGSSWPN